MEVSAHKLKSVGCKGPSRGAPESQTHVLDPVDECVLALIGAFPTLLKSQQLVLDA